MEGKYNREYRPGTWEAWRAKNDPKWNTDSEHSTYQYGPEGENGFVFVHETKEIPGDRDGFEKRSGGRRCYAWKTWAKNRKHTKTAALILALLLAFGSGFGGGLAAVHFTSGSGSGTAPQSITIHADQETSPGEAIAAKVLPSVVGISTTTEVSNWSIFGMTTQELPEGVGTGFVVEEDGYILTNSHVISDGEAKTITVSFHDGSELPGTVLWHDTTLDLAVIKVDATGLTAVELGDSDEVNIGAYAAAIGNPLGLTYDRSVTQGGISGLNRTITVTDNATGKTTTMEGLIQTDAAINSGNSGGPLLNKTGQVIGINSAKAASGEGMGFAIPINVAKPILNEIMKTGTYKKAYIGINGADVATYLQYYPQEDLGTKTGAYVIQIYTDSPAAAAGLKEGDVILAINGENIETMTDLTRQMYKYKSGETVKLTILRSGAKKTINITLGEYQE